MLRKHLTPPSLTPLPNSGEAARVCLLPFLATARQIAGVLQVSTRTVHLWAEAGTIPVALRQGKVVRFHPPAVAKALGLNLPEFGKEEGRK